ncbi:MAG: ATP-binding protein, partial [Actinomycetota bacterium]|nr:ATP-binding protein [Actinomycetota bacterium]
LEDVRLLVSELVTNSFRHGGLGAGDHIELSIRVSPDHIRVEVADPGRGFQPRRPEPSADLRSGWGLFLVDQLSRRWGVRNDGATRVWSEIDRR